MENKVMINEKQNHCVKAKIRDFEVPENDPFANDQLDRKKYIHALTNAAFVYKDGAVIALNGAWGTGKTTFVRMWAQHLKNNGFPVIYYNAWEDDISEEPLFSLLRGLKNANDNEEKKEENDKKLHSVFTIGGKFIAGIIAGALKGFVEKYGKVFAEAAKGGIDAIEKEITDSLEKEEDETTMIMKQFNDELSKYVAFVCDNGKPLVYFIDELDRCSPTFAVKVLERIKHLFDVPNVVFILSIDKQQLAYSINGFYGNEKINSMEYLRRFIDIDYNLPEPEPDKYCEYLYDFYSFTDFVDNESRKEAIKGHSVTDKADLLTVAKLLVKHNHLNLRQTERVFALARIVLCEMTNHTKLFADVFFLMTYLKVFEQETFDSIDSLKFQLQELVDALEKISSNELIEEDNKGKHDYLNAVCHLINCYEESIRNRFRHTEKRYETIYNEESKNHKSNISFTKFDENKAFYYLSHYHERRPDLVCEVEHFTKKIALTEPFQIGLMMQ